MFYLAIIVVCSLPGSNYNGCFELKDNWGPYDSYTTCVLRTAEMKYEAKVIFKDRKFPYKPKSWRCEAKEGI